MMVPALRKTTDLPIKSIVSTPLAVISLVSISGGCIRRCSRWIAVGTRDRICRRGGTRHAGR